MPTSIRHPAARRLAATLRGLARPDGKAEAHGAVRQPALRPVDVPVALRTALAPGERHEVLGELTGLSLAEVHRSLVRLRSAGLLTPVGRRVRSEALLDFLASGVRYAFFARVGPEARGVPTAAAAPPLAGRLPPADAYVWPSPRGRARGMGLLPLFERADRLPDRAPDLYGALALVDALRLGEEPARGLALELLRELVRPARRAVERRTRGPT